MAGTKSCKSLVGFDGPVVSRGGPSRLHAAGRVAASKGRGKHGRAGNATGKAVGKAAAPAPPAAPIDPAPVPRLDVVTQLRVSRIAPRTCGFCGSEQTRVTTTKPVKSDGIWSLRYGHCERCGSTYTEVSRKCGGDVTEHTTTWERK